MKYDDDDEEGVILRGMIKKKYRQKYIYIFTNIYKFLQNYEHVKKKLTRTNKSMNKSLDILQNLSSELKRRRSLSAVTLASGSLGVRIRARNVNPASRSVDTSNFFSGLSVQQGH